jgi:serine/threonine-protein kinase RsbW
MPSDRLATVRIAVPGSEDFVGVLRTVTAAVAGRVPLGDGDVEDLRLAVDEACARLLALSDDPTALHLDLRALPDGFEAVVSTEGPTWTWPPAGIEDSLGWRVLVALSDRVTVEHRDESPVIRIVKRASSSDGGS